MSLLVSVEHTQVTLQTLAQFYFCVNASSVLCDVIVQTLPKFLFQMSHELFCAHKKSMAFPASIFTKFPNAEQRCVRVSCTEFHVNRTINVESRNRD